MRIAPATGSAAAVLHLPQHEGYGLARRPGKPALDIPAARAVGRRFAPGRCMTPHQSALASLQVGEPVQGAPIEPAMTSGGMAENMVHTSLAPADSKHQSGRGAHE
eukprot:353618-Chlamydomonas_euryale.AAC.8